MSDSAPRIHIQHVETLTLSKHAAVLEVPDWADEADGGGGVDLARALQALADRLTCIETQLELLVAHAEAKTQLEAFIDRTEDDLK